MKYNQSLYQSFNDTAKKYPERNALLFMGKYITYKLFKAKVDALASGFTDLKITKGDTVTLAMPNVFEALFAFYALNKIGVICHMVHPLTPVIQMNKFMKQTKSNHLIIVNTFYNHFKNVLEEENTKLILVNPVEEFGLIKKIGYKVINRKKLSGFEYSERILKFSDLYKEGKSIAAKVDPKKTAFLLHSGGTSGTPKTIQLSNYAVNFLASEVPFIMGGNEFEDKHMLAVLPMFHGFGLCMGIHGMLIVGGVDTLMPKFNADEAVKLIKNNQINYIIGVPSLYEALLRHKQFRSPDVRNIKQAYIGGDYVAQDLKNRFDEVMEYYYSKARMLEGYGLTEVVTVSCVNTLNDSLENSVGKPLPGIDMAILNIENEKEFAKVGADGEILVSGPTMMNGYLDDLEATASTIITVGDKKWVRTGDLGNIDVLGYVHFKQRLKRIIKVNGMPVLPSEIENFLMSFEEVKEVSALGKADPLKGSIVKLFIAYNSGKKPFTEAEIKDMIKKNISVYAVPSQIVVLEELPKTIIGKTNVIELDKM
ncbi:MAG: acyl--CoA ligase [Tenericutes bacterium]|nr:acyl--CoA ligase [Mycoplasmatota bacterium]